MSSGSARFAGIHVVGRRGGSVSWGSPLLAWQAPGGHLAHSRRVGGLGDSAGIEVVLIPQIFIVESARRTA